jgi:hypothetical protein
MRRKKRDKNGTDFEREKNRGRFLNRVQVENFKSLHFATWRVLKSISISYASGANHTAGIDNASAVKIYNAVSSLVRFQNKDIFFYFKNTLAC